MLYNFYFLTIYSGSKIEALLVESQCLDLRIYWLVMGLVFSRQ